MGETVVKLLDYDAIIESIISRMRSQAKVRINIWTETHGEGKNKETVEHDELRETVVELFNYVKLFNSLDSYETRVLDRELDQVEIIEELKPFITPKSVRRDPADINSTDLLVRDVVSVADRMVFSFERFINAQNKFRGYLKKDIKTDMVKLSTIKVDKSLEEIMSIAAFDVDGTLKVRYTSDPFVPVVLKSWVQQFYRPSYYNAEASQVVSDYLAPKIF